MVTVSGNPKNGSNVADTDVLIFNFVHEIPLRLVL